MCGRLPTPYLELVGVSSPLIAGASTSPHQIWRAKWWEEAVGAVEFDGATSPLTLHTTTSPPAPPPPPVGVVGVGMRPSEEGVGVAKREREWKWERWSCGERYGPTWRRRGTMVGCYGSSSNGRLMSCYAEPEAGSRFLE